MPWPTLSIPELKHEHELRLQLARKRKLSPEPTDEQLRRLAEWKAACAREKARNEGAPPTVAPSDVFGPAPVEEPIAGQKRLRSTDSGDRMSVDVESEGGTTTGDFGRPKRQGAGQHSARYGH